MKGNRGRMREIRALVSALFVLLAALLVLSLIACSGNPEDSGETQEMTDAYGLPAGLSFDGECLTILSSVSDLTEFSTYENQENSISRTLFLQKEAVETRLGVTLSTVLMPCGSEREELAFLDALEFSVNAGDACYSLSSMRADTAVSAAARGIFCDLLSEPCFEPVLSGSEMLRSALVNDRLYFCFGEFDPSFLLSADLIAVSAPALSAGGLSMKEVLHTVLDGDFTFERLMLWGETYFGEAIGVSAFAASHTQAIPLYLGAGGSFISTAAGSMRIDGTLFDRSTGKFFRELLDSDGKSGMMFGIYGEEALSEHRVAFAPMMCSTVMGIASRSDGRYLLLPLPKYGSSEEDYCTPIEANVGVWAIPIAAENAECGAAALSILFEEGAQKVTPALYETFYGERYGVDAAKTRVFRMLADSACFDYGYTAPRAYGYRFRSFVLDFLASGGSTDAFSVLSERYSSPLSGSVDALNASFRELLEE